MILLFWKIRKGFVLWHFFLSASNESCKICSFYRERGSRRSDSFADAFLFINKPQILGRQLHRCK